jgi:hypothetical protein
MTELSAFLFGCLGGFLINIVRLAELANVPEIERPKTFRDPMYVFAFFALPLVGGALAYIYQADGIVLKPLLAVNIGVSAPLILKTFAASVPSTPPDNVD